MFDPPRCTACFKRIKLSGGLSSFKRIRGLGGAMCAFHVFRGYQPAQTTLLIRGLGGAMCVFHMFERYQRAKTTIIIGVWETRCAYFTCAEECIVEGRWPLSSDLSKTIRHALSNIPEHSRQIRVCPHFELPLLNTAPLSLCHGFMSRIYVPDLCPGFMSRIYVPDLGPGFMSLTCFPDLCH